MSGKKIVPVKVDAAKRLIRGDSREKPRWWMVNLGKRITGTRRSRQFFASEKAAREFIADSLNAARKRGHFAFEIPHKLAIEAVEGAEMLKPYGVTLTTAIEFFIRHNRAGVQTHLRDLIPVYLQTKENPRYRKAQQISLRLFERNFAAKPLGLIQTSDIESWLTAKNWRPLNRRNYIRDISMFFNWAKLRGHVEQNPCAKIPRPKVIQKTPTIYSVAEACLLLETASNHPELQLLPMLAICLFAGVRIEEAKRMRWEMIDWKEGEIRLPGEITKTHQPRNIEILDSLPAWIGPNPPKTGQIIASCRLRERRTELWRLAGVVRKRNALRHTYASFHAGFYRDPGLLQLQLGQQTPSVMFKHYIAATRRTDAEEFFSLRPGRHPQNPAIWVVQPPRSAEESSRNQILVA